MAVAVFMTVLLASLSLGYGINFQDIYNEFLSRCTSQQLATLFIGNFSNKCTDIPSIKVLGAPGLEEQYYLQSIGHFNNTPGDVALSHLECVQLFVTYYGLFRIHNMTRVVVDPNTGSKTFVSSRNLHFSPILHPDHTVVVGSSGGTCAGEVRAIILANQGVLGAVVCPFFMEPIDDDYSFVATLASHPTNATVDGYKSQLDQAYGQVAHHVRITQDYCPQ